MKKIRVQIFPEKTGDNISFFRNEDGKCTRLLKYLVLADGCDFFLVVALGARKVVGRTTTIEVRKCTQQQSLCLRARLLPSI